MALIVTHKLFIDADNGLAYQRFNDFSLYPTPVFYGGDTAKFEVHLVRATGNGSYPMEDVGFPAADVVLNIGTPSFNSNNINAHLTTAIPAPTATYVAPVLTIPTNAISGYITLTLSNTTPALSKTTLPIPLTASATDVEAAIETAVNSVSGWSLANALVDQTGDGKFSVTVSATNTSVVYPLTITVTSAITGVSGYTGTFDLSTSPVLALVGTNLFVNSTLGVSCDTGTELQTFLQIPCIVRAPLLASGS